MINDQMGRGLQGVVLLCALLVGGCSKDLLPFTGVELSLAEMQARYAGVAYPPPWWQVRSDELRGEMFELFDGEVVIGVFEFPEKNAAAGVHSTVHVVAPTAHVKIAWTIDGGSVETTTCCPTTAGAGDCSDYFDSSVHSSLFSVELLELNGVACHRKAEFRIR